MKFALVFLAVDGTIYVESVSLHETKTEAFKVGFEKYGEICIEYSDEEEIDNDLDQDDFGRYCNSDGEPVFQVVPVSWETVLRLTLPPSSWQEGGGKDEQQP